MFATASDLLAEALDLDADATLDAVAATREAARREEVQLLRLAAHWADLHGCVERRSTALPGAERLVELGGDGTPPVAEFAPAEFGAVLGVSSYSAAALIADALDLRHRLPLTWRRLCDLDVAPWIGRKIAQASRGVDKHAAAAVDRTASRWADRLTWGRLEHVVQSTLIAADPAQAETASDAAHSGNGVWISPDIDAGTGTAFVRADATDLDALDQALDAIADQLAGLGDDTTRDVRRARGLGILADQQPTLDLTPTDDDASADDSHTRRPRRRRDAVLYVHIAAEALGDNPDHRVCRVEGVGATTLGQAKRWLGDCHVTLKPVVDLAGVAPVDAYEIPDRLREAVHLSSPADAFPFARSTSRHTDIDHTQPYDPDGPPGQTRVGNLAKLTRRHHRVKTHGDWSVRQPYPGVLVWRSPHGRLFLVDHSGTRRLR